ncbi:TPA: tetrapyrrole methylase, partial [Neisseria meningitidis]
QSVVSKTVADWRRMKEMPNLKKRPTIFVMYAG